MSRCIAGGNPTQSFKEAALADPFADLGSVRAASAQPQTTPPLREVSPTQQRINLGAFVCPTPSRCCTSTPQIHGLLSLHRLLPPAQQPHLQGSETVWFPPFAHSALDNNSVIPASLSRRRTTSPPWLTHKAKTLCDAAGAMLQACGQAPRRATRSRAATRSSSGSSSSSSRARARGSRRRSRASRSRTGGPTAAPAALRASRRRARLRRSSRSSSRAGASRPNLCAKLLVYGRLTVHVARQTEGPRQRVWHPRCMLFSVFHVAEPFKRLGRHSRQQRGDVARARLPRQWTASGAADPLNAAAAG